MRHRSEVVKVRRAIAAAQERQLMAAQWAEVRPSLARPAARWSTRAAGGRLLLVFLRSDSASMLIATTVGSELTLTRYTQPEPGLQLLLERM